MGATTTAAACGGRSDITERPVVMPPELQCLPQVEAAHSQFASRYLAYRRPLRFASEDARNRCDTYYLSPWMVMAVVDVASIDRFESPLQGQDIIEFHYRVSGAIEIGGSWGECGFSGPAWLLWFQPRGCDDASERLGAAVRARETWVSLYCDGEWLRQVAERAASRIDVALEDVAQACATPRFRVGPHLAATVPLVRDIVVAKRDDPLHWLYASAKANELLYATLSHMPGSTPPEAVSCRLTARDRQQLHAVRDLLAADFAMPPRLPALARRAGMNYSKLCSGFRQLFGETTTDFVRRRRLEVAHELLRTTDLQVQQVARRVGYAHHGSFTASFVRHFGCSPKLVSRTPRPRT